MKNVLFLIHGVGRQPVNWSATALAALEEAMRLYPACFPAGKKLEDYVDIAEIRYDDIFDHILDQWAQLANSLPQAAGFDWVDEIGKLLKKAGDERTVFARYGGDVLLYCGFALVARAVRLRVNSVIATRIADAVARSEGGDPPKFAVLAHSLGSAIAQDSLHQLVTGDWLAERSAVKARLPGAAPAADAPDATFPAGLHALFLVSDTSPLLHQAATLYSHLRTATGSFECKSVCVVGHDFDPICHAGRKFIRPAPAPRSSIASVRVRHFHQEGIHDLAHYLSHPGVHAPLFAALIPDFSIACFESARQLAATAEWQGLGGKLKDRLEADREALEQKLRGMVTRRPSIQALRRIFEAYARKIEGVLP
ncbi:MAG TPA: hypothetical protein VFZ74_03960 [Burkholderiales bacterium]